MSARKALRSMGFSSLLALTRSRNASASRRKEDDVARLDRLVPTVTERAFQIVPTAASAETLSRLSTDAAQAVQRALTALARSRDDAVARGNRHAHVLGYCAHFRLVASSSGPVIELLCLSPACRDEHGAPEVVPAV
jgi:hypothetical protein